MLQTISCLHSHSNRSRRQVSRIFSAGPFAAGAQPSQGWLYSWELGQIERSDGFQPGGEGTLAAPVHLPGELRAHLGGLEGESAAAELAHKIILVDRSWSLPLSL